MSVYTKANSFFADSRFDEGDGARHLINRFEAIRQHTINLTQSLSVEDMAVQSMPAASPIKWHLAQTSCFFEQYLLGRFIENYTPFHPAFNTLFGDQNPDAQAKQLRSMITRPSLAMVRSYRDHVDATVVKLIKKLPEEGAAILELGLQREQKTQELMLAEIKHLLSSNPFYPAFISKPLDAATKVGTLKMMELRGGMAEIGYSGNAFSFENELPRHKIFMNPFAITDRKITNGEYLTFVNDGGYNKPHLWLEAGAAWCKREQIEAPLYWRKIEGVWYEVTLHGLMKLDLNRPVCHISYFEADAFARFSGARLPTEFEWEIAANSIQNDFPSLPSSTDNHHDNSQKIDNLILHPKGAVTTNGLKQFTDEAWEWTSSSYAPYPGVKLRTESHIDSAERQMCGQYVLRGGSVFTPLEHCRTSYRHAITPETRWHLSSIRLARSIA